MMDGVKQAAETRQKLAQYKQLLDVALEKYCKQLLEVRALEYTLYSEEVVKVYCSILSRGGKRMRGALVMNAYEMLGGTDQQVALQAAMAIEMIHAYVLIADDICDRSRMRRGGPAAHIMLAEYHRQQQLHGDSDFFGIAQALNASMLGSHLAQLEFTKLPVDDTTKLEIMHDLNESLITTIHGQLNDIFNEAVQTVDEEQVRNVLTWKTAYYSFLNPLQVGTILAHIDPVELDVLKEYSVYMGLAFQIADDILGTFGNEADSGKSTMDDLKEGKITILITRALARVTPSQRIQLLAALGNEALDRDTYEACKLIIEETGALDYAQKLADEYARQAVTVLDSAPSTWQLENVTFLRDLAGLITHRSA